jgi:DNA-binding LacI/PurR family transcriptional regulator
MRYGPASTLVSLEQAARSAGFFVSVAIAPHPTPEAMQDIMEKFMDQSVEGVAVIAPGPEVAAAARTASAHVPVLMLSSLPREDGGPVTVCVDQELGARMAARHLIDLGHTDIVQLTGPDDWFDAQARVRGWRAEIEESGVPARPEIVGDWTAERGYEVGVSLLADLPTAVFAANDQMALGLLRAFAEAGVDVPGRVSVIGFDDIEGANNFYPPLTTVRQDFQELGATALEVLVVAIGGGRPETEPIAPELVRRASTGPPRRALTSGERTGRRAGGRSAS